MLEVRNNNEYLSNNAKQALLKTFKIQNCTKIRSKFS